MVLRLEGSWSLLVGKRFLCLSEEEDRTWDANLISEWPWKSGRIRAVSHTDISKPDLKVIGNFQRDPLNQERDWGSWCRCVYSVCVCTCCSRGERRRRLGQRVWERAPPPESPMCSYCCRGLSLTNYKRAFFHRHFEKQVFTAPAVPVVYFLKVI